MTPIYDPDHRSKILKKTALQNIYDPDHRPEVSILPPKILKKKPPINSFPLPKIPTITALLYKVSIDRL